MCGLAGIVWAADLPPSGIDAVRAALLRMQRALAHRGPDGHGVWVGSRAALAHTRLAVVGTQHAAHQPMLGPGGAVLAYNGEVYNLDEFTDRRHDRCTSDTRELLTLLEAKGPAALRRVRGMYALALAEPTRDQRSGSAAHRSVLLARDPLGVKPLFYACTTLPIAGGVDAVVFASEITAMLATGWVQREPDAHAFSAALTTTRRTLGERTLVRGVRTLAPGSMLRLDAHGSTVVIRGLGSRQPQDEAASQMPVTGTAAEAMAMIDASVRAHAKADVPVCAMLSGGLDSAAIVSLWLRQRSEEGRREPVHTYCAGSSDEDGNSDRAHARMLADELGTVHRELVLNGPDFRARWVDRVLSTLQPLATPNEVAIASIAEMMRHDGFVVALSGEGADEMLAGYDAPLRAARSILHTGEASPARAMLDALAWIPPSLKPTVLRASALEASDHDRELVRTCEASFAQACQANPRCAEPHMHRSADERLADIQRWLADDNLPHLLGRLDGALMASAIEGRVPFADARVAAWANALTLRARARLDAEHARTKIPLRRAMRGIVPQHVLDRPKASFALPIASWIGPIAGALRHSPAAQCWFTPQSIELAASDPQRAWRLAWPMCNLAMFVDALQGQGEAWRASVMADEPASIAA